jgi:hypothetical protein
MTTSPYDLGYSSGFGPIGSLVVMPDAEVLMIQALLAQAELAPLGNRIYSRVPKERTYPLTRVFRYGGEPLHPEGPYWVDQPALQIDTWATTRSEAHDIGETLRACCKQRLVGSWPDHGVVVSTAVSALVNDPDPTFSPPRPRTRFTCAMRVHPG